MSFKILPALKDTYLTDRYIGGVSQVTANVGDAGSLDLYKLYGLTSTVSGTVRTPNTEMTRILVQFDLTSLRQEVAAGRIDPSNPSFNCKLHLHDVFGGQPTPSNFTVAVYPLSASFDEGLGKDVVLYGDSDTSNWLTGSIANGAWFVTGAGLGGNNSGPCDYLTASSGLGFKSTQFFVTGQEDLDIDVTTVVSATLAGLIPDQGFRISFDAPLETDQHTYFVKRFASRTAYNDDLHPKLYVRYDDSIQDDSSNVYLDSTSYLFLYNYVRSAPANLVSGSSTITGNNSISLRFVGSFPRAALTVVSSSTCLTPSGRFTFGQPSSVLFSGSYIASSSLINSSSANAQLVGQLTGNYATLEPFVPSGTFYLPDGVTPVLSGTAFFTGTLNGISDVYVLTGTFAPDASYLFSASYITSQTLGPAPFSTTPVIGGQLALGHNFQTGIYSASVLLSSNDPDLRPQWTASGSVTLVPIWGSLDGTVTYLTGSAIKVLPPQRGAQSIDPRRFEVTVLGLRDHLTTDEQTVLRVNIFDYTVSYMKQSVRLPVELPGVVVRDVHYQVRDNVTKRVIVPFDTKFNSTRVSNDSAGMYFMLDTFNLISGRTYVIDVMIITGNNKQLYEGASPAFRVDDTA